MNLLQLLLGQIPEAIFIALFMIFAKELKTKRLLFTIIVIIEYLLCKYTFTYDWMFHISFMIMVYITLKVLYKEKSQITDVFIFAMSYIIIVITSIICMLLFSFNPVTASITNRILLFIPLVVFNYKLSTIQNVYKKYWNRNDKVKKKMKSITFRSLNVVIFNLLFASINALMLIAIYYNTK